MEDNIMKTLSIFMAGIFAVLSASAQYGRYDNQYGRYNSTVTVTLNNNNNEQVYIDGRNYSSGYNTTFQINDLRPGVHTIQIVNNARRGILGALFGGGNNNTNTSFTVRDGYNTELTVRNNGRVHIRETKNVFYQNENRNRYDRDRDRDRDQYRDRDRDRDRDDR